MPMFRRRKLREHGEAQFRLGGESIVSAAPIVPVGPTATASVQFAPNCPAGGVATATDAATPALAQAVALTATVAHAKLGDHIGASILEFTESSHLAPVRSCPQHKQGRQNVPDC